MSIASTIREKWIVARKARKDTVAISMMTVLHSDVEKIGKENNRKATDEEAVIVIRRLLKSNAEMQQILTDVGDDLDVAKHEREILECFLPKQLTEPELNLIIGQICIEVEATSLKDMGRVMRVLKERHGTAVTMQLASAITKRLLG
ncbi:hypothetical protein LCGC14_1682080 [marine sediment metagenome]|uniref:GatB/YqeY domain-containing protein n=1 Tax=marine sediment metagenome TaxID=412755 RepID=A0A0F9KNB4_9ZZZZ